MIRLSIKRLIKSTNETLINISWEKQWTLVKCEETTMCGWKKGIIFILFNFSISAYRARVIDVIRVAAEKLSARPRCDATKKKNVQNLWLFDLTAGIVLCWENSSNSRKRVNFQFLTTIIFIVSIFNRYTFPDRNSHTHRHIHTLSS